MIARTLVIGVVLLLALVLQTTLFADVSLAGFRPDLLLLLTTAFALRDGPIAGMRTGFAAGVLHDLHLTQSAVGTTALVLVGVGYTVGRVRPYLALDSLTAPALLVLATGVVGTASTAGLLLLLGDQTVTFALLVEASLLVGIYNLLLAPVAFWVVDRVDARFALASVPSVAV